jgi:SPP1 family predicted phage head-tail adaptor
MDTGKLNRRIQIQSLGTAELDAFQQPLPAAWSPIYKCWANIDIQGSQLVYSTAEFMSKVAHRITIRYTSSVIFTAKQRIVYTEPTTGVVHTYEIEAVLNPNQANKEIILMAYELEATE